MLHHGDAPKLGREIVDMYDCGMVKLYNGDLNLDDVNGVGLWNISLKLSRWGRPVSTPIHSAWNYLGPSYEKTIDGGMLVLWFPAFELVRRAYDPLEMGPWVPRGVVLSGWGKAEVGYIYSKGGGSSLSRMLDTRDGRGVTSSMAMKYLVDMARGKVVDPYAHACAILPIWCRRSLISYIGWTESAPTYDGIVKKLAQVELPGIQLELPTT